ncbi:MAG: exonuclease SbcCD subunit D C-terminal domain-containing protein [Desulfobulbus sp.]
MKILHTSDWHLGRTLCGRRRYAEFSSFLDWLAGTIRERGIDVLLVAGDVFDGSAPSNRAQELYYRFLCRVADSPCRHVVIVAGNHDSPSFLEAPRELLRALDIHVVGAAGDPADEVLVLADDHGTPELIVCAAPYLRDREIRVVEAGESIEDKEQRLQDGIRAHYAALAELAEQQRELLGADIPIVAMGHLFTAGGKTSEGDGVRELYVGALAHVAATIFSPCFDYLALGHLHVPQKVAGSETRRYSGSPLAMGFGEAKQEKSVCEVLFRGRAASVTLLPVPVWQQLESLRGDWPFISDRIAELASTGSDAWIEVIYEGEVVLGDLREQLDSALADTRLELLRVRNHRVIDQALGQMQVGETLNDLSVDEVFARCLDAHGVSEEQRPELVCAYREILLTLHETDQWTDPGGQA